MKITWTLLQVLLGFGLISISFCNECNVVRLEECFNTLVHYDDEAFPLYGDADTLENTCRIINDSFECVEVHTDLCRGMEECGNECNSVINNAWNFTQTTGLEELYKRLCIPQSDFREIYLENYSCLHSNKRLYNACHNDSEISHEYMDEIKDRSEYIAAQCCFFTWYQGCFINITRQTCNEDATELISTGIKILTDRPKNNVCQNRQEICDRPPMPPEDEDHKTTVDDNTTDENTSLPEVVTSEGTSHAYSLWTFGTAVCWVLLSKYIL